MMNTIAFESLLGLVGLWVAICYLWRDFRIDSYREDIFSVRDEMLLYAADNDLLEHPAHTLLRARMNGLLRHGHELTMTRLFIAFALYDDRMRSESSLVWDRALQQLSVEESAKIKDYNLRVNIFVLQHVLYLSFFRYLVLRPLMVGVHIRTVMENPEMTTTVEKLESATLEEEEVCELAPA